MKKVLVCRALAGLCAGLIFKLVTKLTKNVIVRSSLTGLSAAVFNTIFFVSALILLFGKATVGEATGRYSSLVTPLCKHKIICDKDLILKCLIEVCYKNC